MSGYIPALGQLDVLRRGDGKPREKEAIKRKKDDRKRKRYAHMRDLFSARRLICFPDVTDRQKRRWKQRLRRGKAEQIHSEEN